MRRSLYSFLLDRITPAFAVRVRPVTQRLIAEPVRPAVQVRGSIPLLWGGDQKHVPRPDIYVQSTDPSYDTRCDTSLSCIRDTMVQLRV